MNQHLSRRAFLKRSLFTFLSVIPLTAGYSYGVEPRWIEVTEQRIRLSRLSSVFEGLRVVIFGDLHVGFHINEKDVTHVVSKINALKPDLLLFTGDLVDDRQDVLLPILPHLQKLHAPLGKFAVLGNHDYQGDQIAPKLKYTGFHVLRNTHHVINKGGDRLVVAGVEDMLMGKPDLYQAVEGSPDSCTLLLSHCPDFANNIVANQIDLQISGHSHGGQIRFPFLGAVITPPGGQIYTDGFYSIEQTNVYVNRGIGTTILPFRFNCRPQISILHLFRT